MLKRSIESLAGGAVIYVAMAACSGAPTASFGAQASAGMPSAEGGQPAAAGGAPGSPASAGVMAASAGTVPMAMAAEAGSSGSGSSAAGACGCQGPEPRKPTVVEAPCEMQDGALGYFAIAKFQGATELELSRVTAIVQYSEDGARNGLRWPDGFLEVTGGVLVGTEKVSVGCGNGVLVATRVRFVMP